MIPELIDIGGPWKVLPPGVHTATMDEIERRFAVSDNRRRLFSGFQKGVKVLSGAGCQAIFLDGSFVTEKSIPEDYDVCWDLRGVDVNKLDPVLLDFSDKRKKQKDIYCGEFFPLGLLADGVHFFYDFFQIDRYTGKPKGIINLKMR
ncbi:MAG: hypothetical protein PHS61_05760 [Candidatus Omnitrophica bacterium]|nr:hypothetical protein [Candidatus Omnitrophota bacterium]